MNPPRDGVFNDNGLSAEFRFLRGTFDRSISIVETATGEHWVHDSQLTYDPPIELAPEAAAVVASMDPPTSALLRKALERLASHEAFGGPRALHEFRDEELLLRMKFAAAALNGAQTFQGVLGKLADGKSREDEHDELESKKRVVNHGLDTEFVQSDDEWQIWTPDETGAIIGSGKTTDEAVSDAVANMEALSAELRRRIPILTPKSGTD